jgi:glutamine synthetase
MVRASWKMAATTMSDSSRPHLPRTLDEALQALEADTSLHEYLGDEFVRLFLAVKRHEVNKARKAIPEYGSSEWTDIVTDWERQNLFEYL